MAQANESATYVAIPHFKDQLTLMMRNLAEEAEIYDEDVEVSEIFRDLISHENKYDEEQPVGDAVQFTTYSASPAPQIILRLRGYRSLKSTFLENDPYFRGLRKQRAFSYMSGARLTKLWSQAVVRTLTPLLQSPQEEQTAEAQGDTPSKLRLSHSSAGAGPRPWIIELVDEQKVKKGTSPYPTLIATEMVLHITTPEGIHFRFDRTITRESTLSLASLIFAVVRDAQAFAKRDTHWRNLIPGNRSATARAHRFLKDQTALQKGLEAMSKRICDDLLKRAR